VSLLTELHKHLVEVPLPLRLLRRSFRTALPKLVREVSPEPIDPMADRFVANVDTAFEEQVFDVQQRQREADIHHDRELDDFR